MSIDMITRRAKLTSLVMIGAMVVTLLTACGGGGGAAGTTGAAGSGTTTGGGTTAVTSGTIQLTLQDTNTGAASNSVGSGPLTASAKLLDKSSAPVPNVVVTFVLSSTIATLSPSTGTALTDANGIAKVNIQSANIGSGAVEITASATVGTAALTAKNAFSVTASPTATAAAINFVGASPADKSIVIKGAGGNGRTEVALVTFKVVDNTNAGIANNVVNFTTQSSQNVTLATTSATTGQDGLVSVALSSGTQPTSVTVIATVAGTTISTRSDTVTVTTGQPVQGAFSISVEKHYVEGLTVDNEPNKVLILVADQFGGAVADGTQVVFTTDSGAIVGTGGALCLTVSGACSVTWRSQLPRDTGGVATVVATATSSTLNLATSIKFFYSGSYAVVYDYDPTTKTRTTDGGPIGASFGSTCDVLPLKIEVADSNDNPMPEGTTITVLNPVNVSATVTPASVLYDGRKIVAGAGGTIHSLDVTPSNCDVAGTKTVTASLDVNVKTPHGETTTRVNLGQFKAK